MPKKVPPPLSLTLLWLRNRVAWTQTELADAAGFHNNVLCDLEHGVRELDRDQLNDLAALMGFGPGDVELVHLTLLAVPEPRQGSAAAGPAALTPEELRLARQAAAALGLDTAALAEPVLVDHAIGLRLELARAQAASLWDELQRCSPGQRRLLVECSLEFQTWALAERLTEESVRAAPRSAADALDLARLAVRVAQLAPGDDAWRSLLEGYTRAFVANALRVAGSLAAADAEWREVRRLWLAGAGADPAGVLPEWRLLDLEASLRCVTRQFDTALALLDRAAAVAPPAALGRILLNRAQALEQAGDIQAAVAALRDAAPLVTATADPRLRWVLAFNLTVNLCHLQLFEEADIHLPELRQRAGELDHALDLLHVQWLAGRVAAGLGRRQEALDTFGLVRDAWTSRGDAIGTAMVSLEIAILYLQEGRTAAVRELVGTLARIVLAAKGVESEALAAFRLFSQAAQSETATMEQARSLLALFERCSRRTL
jgi:tetratricopeptide (TPR) repeat protein